MKEKITLRFVMAQLDFLVGDIEGNAEKIISAALTAKKQLEAKLIIFPELALTGYPPEDLLLREGLYLRCQKALDKIMHDVTEIDILLGHPIQQRNYRYNAASLIRDGQIVATYRKHCLPNYNVFDEARYFRAGGAPLVIPYRGIPIGILICEDLWHRGPFVEAVEAGAKLIVSINASPFDCHKHEVRTKMLEDRTKEGQVPILYINCVGGQDELVFDGGSLMANAEGEVSQQGPFFEEKLIPIDVICDPTSKRIQVKAQPSIPLLEEDVRIYKALVLGVKDYIEKNHFPGAIIGLSGGIDSALTLAIAVDAIGADKVEGVLMPSRYTSELSVTAALEQARLLNVKTQTISIDSVFNQFLESLAPEFKGTQPGIAEENLQARCRGMLLMAISNKKGSIVLATGNKSEMSVGYSTLYGDMVGGFCVLKDIFKTLVYRLATHRNDLQYVIPQQIIDRAPSAELAPNQKDEDSLPPYSILDRILEFYIENDKSVQDIIDLGFDKATVKRTVLLVDRSEYKRRQAPPGVRITTRAFGRDRRYPITSGYSHFLKD